MLTYAIELYFDRGYIADPYWPELSQLIDIQKKSGMNRAKSDANRRKALEGYLANAGMTHVDYENLEKKAKMPFYRNEENEIIIPELHVSSFMVATCDEARAAQRPCDPNQVRSRFIFTSWTTGKTERDGVWERFALVTGGTGQTLSNQRGLRRSEYISKFSAHGTLSFEPDYVDPKTLRQAIDFGGRVVGIGASRKMGWGRFDLKRFQEL